MFCKQPHLKIAASEIGDDLYSLNYEAPMGRFRSSPNQPLSH